MIRLVNFSCMSWSTECSRSNQQPSTTLFVLWKEKMKTIHAVSEITWFSSCFFLLKLRWHSWSTCYTKSTTLCLLQMAEFHWTESELYHLWSMKSELSWRYGWWVEITMHAWNWNLELQLVQWFFRYLERPLSLPECRLTSVPANSGTPYVLFQQRSCWNFPWILAWLC